jgi:hypothetical protein
MMLQGLCPTHILCSHPHTAAGAAIRSGGDLAARELAALQALTNALGSGFWLNTIVAVTHAGRLAGAAECEGCSSRGTFRQYFL